MLSREICVRCSGSKFYSDFDDNVLLCIDRSKWQVTRLEIDIDDPATWCPYVLEHVMKQVEDTWWQKFVRRMRVKFTNLQAM